MALDIQIASTSIAYKPSSFSLVKNLDMSADLSFMVIDTTGLHHYTNRQPVTITDTIKGLIFAGYIDQPDEQNLYPQPGNQISVHCMDYREKALKRRPTYDYAGMLAGDIVIDMHANYLAAEGVLANYAYRRDIKQAQFAAGTLSGTSATNNIPPGDLELSPAGSALTTVTDTTADWATGTLTGCVAANNQLVLNSRTGIAFSGDNNGNQGNNAYVYWQIWQDNGSPYTIASDDTLIYTVWINKSSPEIQAGVDGVCSDGSTIRDFFTGPPSSHQFMVDQNGLRSHPSTNLAGYADNQWYARQINLAPAGGGMLGKSVNVFTLAFEGNAGGHYAAYFHTIKIVNGGTTKLTIYNNTGSLNANQTAQNIGYGNISVTTPSVYDSPGTRISPATSLTSVGIANTGIIAISSTEPTNTTVEVDTGFDNGATWQPATDRTAIAGLIAGASLSGVNLTTKQTLTITGDDPIVTPAVSSLAANFTPSYSAIKHDTLNFADTTAQWNALGADQGGSLIADQITLNNQRRNWDDASIASQTLYGASNPFHGTFNRELKISTSTSADVRSRLDFAGTWNNFTLSVDVQVPDDANQSIGPTYRTTNWGNGNNTGGWVVDLWQTQLQLGYGDNSGGAGSGAYTNVATFNPPSFAPVAGSWHTLTLVVSGDHHQVSLDGVLYIDVHNATYQANTGYVAMHGWDNSGVGKAFFFDNFGIGNFLSGAYETNNISLNTLATIGDSFIAWREEPLPAGCQLLVQATLDAGMTFQTCTNGAEIPGLTPGTNTVGKNLRIYFSLIAGSVAYTPTLDGVVIWVTSSFSSSGTRISPVLNLFNGRAGGTSLTWTDVLATGCTLGMDIGTNGAGPWTDVTANNGQPLPSSIIFAQPDPYIDFFKVDSHTSYTSTDYGGGAVGVWTWDTANNRLVGSGGTNATLRYDGFNRQDMNTEADLNWSDGGGLFVRMTDVNHLYSVQINDASAGSAPNTLKLFKFISGTPTQLGATQTINFTRGTYRHIKLDAQGTTISVTLDGNPLLSVTDASISGAGKCGLLCGTKIQALSLRVLAYGDSVNGETLYTRQRLASTVPTATPQVTGITLSVRDPEIGNGALIPNTNYAYVKSIGEAYNDLASQSTSPHPYMVWIDDTLQLHFKHNQAQPAPFYLSTANGNILWAGNPPVVSSPDMLYRNHQIVDGGTDTVVLPPKAVKGDGFTQTWIMPMNLASAPSILLNGAIQTIGVQGVDTGKDFYWQQGSNAVSQDPSEIPPGKNDTVIFGGLLGQENVRVIQDNVNGTGPYMGTVGQTQLALITGDTGIVEDYVSVPGLNRAAATTLNTSLLQQYGKLGRDIPLSTNQWGLEPGMLVGITIPQNNVINAFPLITQVTISAKPTQDVSNPYVIGGLLYRFDLSTTEGPNVGDWVSFQNKLIAASAGAMR